MFKFRLFFLRFDWVLAPLFLGIIFFAVININRYGISSDPDSYYHLAISRMTLENGLIRALPQADNMAWKSFFTEKEFLFQRHQDRVKSEFVWHLFAQPIVPQQ